MNIGARVIFSVTREAGIERLARGHQREGIRDGRLAALRFDVPSRRTMATFATGLCRGFLTGGQALIVRIAEEVLPLRRMADPANGTADVAVRIGGGDCVGKWLWQGLWRCLSE